MIDYGTTKSKFPAAFAGSEKPAPDEPEEDDAEMAEDKDDAEGDTSPRAALAEAQTALESALSAVKAAMKGIK